MKKITNFLLITLLAVVMVLSPVTASAIEFDPGVELHSSAGVLVNLDTGVTVFSQRADERMEPASVTKIMVALLLFENVHNLSTLQITAPGYVFDLLAGTNSSLSGVMRGETLTAEQLLYCLMVPSGNDAAMVLADYMGGGDIDVFIEMMNKRAKELGCNNTHYANPHGLHDPNHYTTANDTAKLIQYILSSPYAEDFMRVCKTSSYTLGPSNVRDKNRTITSTNSMQQSSNTKYYYKYVEGIKTGSTGEAGYCLATTAYNASVNYRYLCVTFNAPMRDADGNRLDNGAMYDHKALYEWAFNNLEYKQLVAANTAAKEIKLNYAWEKDSLLLVPPQNFSALVPKDIHADSIVLVPNKDVPAEIDAPVEKGQVLGTANVMYAGMVLGTVELVADESVEASQLLLLQEQAMLMLESKWLKIGAAALGVLLVLYVVISVTYNIRAKKKRRRHSSLNGKSNRRY